MSGEVRVVASKLADGKEIALTNLKSLSITAELSSPAVSMSLSFAPDAPLSGLGAVKVYADNKLLFEGKTDSQKSTVLSSGVLMRLDARSAGALLLDNQAQPCVMLGAQLTSVFNRFIAPYGFLVYNPNKPDRSKYLPMYTVRSGMSEWDALIYFTRRVYGVTPYVIDSQVMLDRPWSGAPFTISNTGEGTPYTSITHTLTPYNVLSQVFLRDEMGFYSSVVNNSAAVHTKAVRKRYVIPPNEYVDSPAMDANQRIRRSMFDSEEAVVTLPGVIDAALGQDTRIRDRFLTLYNLMVVKREYLLDENGLVTRLTLKSSVYYD